MSYSVDQASRRWWSEVRVNGEQLIEWLQKQYHGEVTAAERIERFSTAFVSEGSRERFVLEIIAGQERQHAAWVGELLNVRGIQPQVLDKTERYWEETLSSITSLESGAAVAAHAEIMRLSRIEAIAEDPEAPADIRQVFSRILPQERFHARAFSEIAGREAMTNAQDSHQRGLIALGLITVEEIL